MNSSLNASKIIIDENLDQILELRSEKNLKKDNM